MPAFISRQKILFQHCDPARIVFFPRYFELLNQVVEEWFEEGIGVSFADMHMKREEGIPTLKVEAMFMAPSRLGDVLEFTLKVIQIGNTSATLLVKATCNGELRLEMKQVIVHISNVTGKSRAWPDDMRLPMMRFMGDQTENEAKAHA